jgi:predicted patatin/cPLA2 family phospholipase
MKKGIKVLNLSGAATKIAGLAGAAYYTFNNYGYRPDIITGISSGAILTVPIAMRKWDILNEMVKTFTLDDIFDKPPVNEENKVRFTAYVRAAIGKSSFGTQNNLPKTLSKVITEEDWLRYQVGDYPECYIGAVDFKSGSRYIVNLKNKGISYCEYLNLVNASASIPLAVEPVRYKDMLLYDGGTRNHILSGWVLRNFSDIEENISIYSRPKDYYGLLDPTWKDNNLISVFSRYTDISLIEISKRDEREEMYLTEKKKIDTKQIFIPSVIKELYDTDNDKLTMLYDVAYKEAKKILGDESDV